MNDENRLGGVRVAVLLARLAGDRDPFTPAELETPQELSETTSLAILHRQAQWSRRERVKELTCLYEMAKLSGRSRGRRAISGSEAGTPPEEQA